MTRGRRRMVVALVIFVAVGGFFGRTQLRIAAENVLEAVGDWSTKLRDFAAAEPQSEVEFRTREGESASVLIVLGSEPNSTAFALLVADPGGPPLLVVLPQDLLVGVPGFGEFRLVDAVTFGGADLAALSVVNQFGIRLDGVVALPSGSVTGGLPGPVVVDLSVPLFVEASDGSVSRILSAGRTEVTADFVETLLVTAGAGDSFEWIQRQGSAWRSILDAIAESPGTADRITALGGIDAALAADLLVTVAADPEAFLATIPVSSAESSTGAAALVPAGDQADDFLRQRLGHLLLRPGGRPRLEVLNGNGRIGTTAGISAILIRNGFHLVRTDNADDFDYQETLVVAQGSHAEAWAREVVELLGRGLLFLEVRAPSGVVDVSIIVGHDIPSGEG
ncbi:MAG: LytR C-terminal domain-containing protein [Acidobacteria bacterium]|nr:LytR C-terminal domain-containing protein [Acidobacteriota bacterium]